MRDLLLVKQYRVEVFKNKGGKNNNDWSVEYRASPGNLLQLEDILSISSEDVVNTGLMAVRLSMDGKNRMVGVGYIDCALRQMSVCEFADSEELYNLEALVVQLGPKE